MVLPLFSGSLGGNWLEFFQSCFPWSDGSSGAGRSSEVVSPEGWLVSSIWFLLCIMQVAIKVCGCLLPDGPRYSDMLLFMPSSSWVTPQQQLWLASSSPNKVGQFSFVHYPQSHKISSVIHHAPALGGWFCAPILFSIFVPCVAPLTEFNSLPHPPSQRLIQHSTLHPLTVVNCTHCVCHSLLFRWCNLPMSCTALCSEEDVWCMALTCWVCRFTQAYLDPSQQREMVGIFYQGRYSLGLGPGQWNMCKLSTVSASSTSQS
jgi:hypothetical protein